MIVQQYLKWAGSYQENQITITYDRIGNGTRVMAENIAEGLGKADPQANVKPYSLAKPERNDVMTWIFKSRAIMAGSPTINHGVLASLLVTVKKRQAASLAQPQPCRQTIQAATVTQGRLELTTHYLGVIEPYTRGDLSARISGMILALPKRKGDSVHSGEPMTVIDDRELVDRAQAIDAEALATGQKIAGAQSA